MLGRSLVAALRPHIDAGGAGFWLHSALLRTAVTARLDPPSGNWRPEDLPVAFRAENAGQLYQDAELLEIEVRAIDPSVFTWPDDLAESWRAGCRRP